MRLQGKSAIVTGAASGFGAGIARRFAAEGAWVILADIDLAGAQRLAAEIGGFAIGGDVTRQADVQAMVDCAVAEFGGLDIVVNNAGVIHRNSPVLEVEEAEFDRLFAVNVKSLFWMVRAAMPVMRAQGRGGSMVTVSSTAGLRPRPGLTWYNATKGALNVATQALAQEFAGDGIRVNAVCPVMGETAMLADALGSADPAARARVLATIPLGRLSTPADVANACLWLAEDTSSFITGILLPVDGGRTA